MNRSFFIICKDINESALSNLIFNHRKRIIDVFFSKNIKN